MIICWVWVSVGFFFRSGRAICFHLKKFHAHLISNTPTSDQVVFKEFFLCPIICQTTVHIHGVSGADRGWWCRLGMFLLREGGEGVPGNTDPALWEDTKTAPSALQNTSERGYSL